jgi:uncharacterized membrane protein YphA (DoxX/SURF4 family)
MQPNTTSSISTGPQPVRLRFSATPDPTSAAGLAAGTGVATRTNPRLERLGATAHRWLVAYSIDGLRVSLGSVFLGFGALKLFPGVSPAANLVATTTHILTRGLIPGSDALIGVGVLECVIGLCLISGRALRPALCLLGVQLVGILSPLVLLAPRLFSGPHNAPTLEGQYVLKDVVFVAATLVLAATLPGGALRSRSEPPAGDRR